MRQHFWIRNFENPQSFDSACGMIDVPWFELKGDRGKKCPDCNTRIKVRWESWQRVNYVLARQIDGKNVKLDIPAARNSANTWFWTDEADRLKDFQFGRKVREYARQHVDDIRAELAETNRA